MIRFYILPIEIIDSVRLPKYLRSRRNPTGIPCRWGLLDYGLIDAALVAADVTTEQHDLLAANSDVASAPENIDQNISDAAIPKVMNVLEQLRIPADWVNNTFTYRGILRMVAGLFLFAQRHHGMHGEPLIDNVAQLDLRWNQIPLARRQRIQATADALGYDYSQVQTNWLVRRILKHLGDQWADKPVLLGMATL